MKRETVSAKGAPEAIGPYSQAVKGGGLVFASGQIPLDPATGVLTKGSVAEQTEMVLKALRNVLEAAGSNLDSVVKTTVYMTDMKRFGEMNEIYAKYFPESPPARSAVEVSALPKGADVEIEAVALDEG